MIALEPAITTAEGRRIVSVTDAAIDRQTTDIDAYGRDYEESHLHLTGGEEPTWFYLRPLSDVQAKAIARRCAGDYERVLEECFRVGVVAIKGLGSHPVRYEVVPGWIRKRLSDATCGAIPDAVRYEVGAVVWNWSTLSEEHRKNS